MKQRDLILLPFPFTDFSGRKVRPAIIISNDEYNRESVDILVVGVTSQGVKGEYSLALTQKDLEAGTLIANCYIKVENLLKIDKRMCIKKIGTINKEKHKEIKESLQNLLR